MSEDTQLKRNQERKNKEKKKTGGMIRRKITKW